MINPSQRHLIDKLLILAILFTLFPLSGVFAQKFSLGVKAAPLATWSAYGDKDDGKRTDNKIKIGFYAAGFISFPLKNNYECVIEGGFSQKGRKVEFEGKMNYASYYFIDAALLLRKSFKFYLGKNVPATWFVNVGPHISYWLGGNGVIGAVGSDGQKYDIEFVKDSINPNNFDFKTMYMLDANRWLFGVDMGIGMTAPIKTTQRVMVEFRFTWGHTFYGSRTTANYNWIEFTDNNMRANERVLSLSVAYAFDFDLKEGKKGRSTKDKEVHRKRPRKKRR
jgi:hypothetical protein